MRRAIAVAILIAFGVLGCDRTDSQRKDIQKHLPGTWYTTNGTGRVLALNDQGRVTLFSTITHGTIIHRSDFGRNAKYEITSKGSKILLRFLKVDPRVEGDVEEEFEVIKADESALELLRKGPHASGKSTILKRLDHACFTTETLPDALPNEAYLVVPAGATQMNINGF